MKKKLLIVESPAKIKTIKKFLGNEFIIMSTVGHIKDLPKRKTGITINDSIHLEYTIMDDKEKVVADLVKAASTADTVYLAPDPDREGEIIAWHVAQEIEKVIKDRSIIKRISFNEITESAIHEALKNSHSINIAKVNAQQARRVLDRWVGYEVSPILWKKVSKGLSAGRVQSVVLKLVCIREQEIRNFTITEYWSISACFQAGKSKITASLSQIHKKKAEIKTRKAAEKIIEDLRGKNFLVTAIKDTKRVKNPLPPFITSTLQQASYNRLGLSVQKTMQIAQKLYEGLALGDSNTPTALITYMRTDSVRISDGAVQATRKFINQTWGKDYLPSKANVFSGTKSKAKKDAPVQDAHEAIRPIDVTITPDHVKPYLDSATYKLYNLIWQRFVACQMNPAQYAQRQVTIEGTPYTFKVTGSTLLFDGFLKLYHDDAEESASNNQAESDAAQEDVIIPKDLKEQDSLDLASVDPEQHFTQPPARYTQASLVKEMQKEGIGRPSTYATVLQTIQARAYTNLDERKRFVPTELGIAVTKLLDENLTDIMNISFTANMEENLDKIAHGELDRDTLLKQFYTKFSQDIKKFGGDKTERPSEETELTCTACNKNKLFIKFGKSGAFLGCGGYPDCPFTTNFSRQEDGSIKIIEKVEPKLLEETCPTCSSNLIERVGRYGPFIACSNYPKCKYIKQESAGFKCIVCKTGAMNKRSWRGTTFWGCSNYPECKSTIPGDIEETPCPSCARPYLLKRIDRSGNPVLICHNKECPSLQKNSKPQKSSTAKKTEKTSNKKLKN